MKDVKCPYCGAEQNIHHDDGYGFDEYEYYEQDCVECGKEFKYLTTISYSYEVFCAGQHDLENDPAGRHPNLYQCTKCDHYEAQLSEKQDG